MLVINGADDHFIPPSDTLDFRGRRNTEVHLIDGTGHVAMSKAPEVVPKTSPGSAGRWRLRRGEAASARVPNASKSPSG